MHLSVTASRRVLPALNRARSRGLVALAIMLLATAAEAATVTWTGAAGNGLWFDAGNWSGGSGVPGAGDDAVFVSPAAGTVSLGGATASISSLSLTTANGLSFGDGTLMAGSFTLNSGTSTLNAHLTATALSIGSDAHLRVDNGAQVAANTLTAFGLPSQARLSVLGGSLVSVPSLDLANVRIDADGSNSRLRFTSGQAQAATDLYLTNGGVLGCIGASATLNALAGALTTIHVGNLGQPGRLDCASLTFNKGVNALARIDLSHNQNGYRLERPNGTAISLGGSMQLAASNAVRSVLPGIHGYTGSTMVSNGAHLELAGELTGSAVSIAGNSALLGSGRIHGALNVAASGAIRPGAHDGSQPGTLRFGSLGLVDQSALVFDLALPGTAGNPNDLVRVDGDANIGSGRVHIATLGTVGRYRLMEIGGTTTGSLVLESVPAGQSLADWQVARTGGEVDLLPPGVLQVEPQPLQLSTVEQSQIQGTATLRNIGNGNIHVTQIVSPVHPDFTRQGGTCASEDFDLAPAATCTLVYGFAPSQPGLLATVATIGTFPQAAGASAVSLEGTASRLPPQLGPATLEFGTQTVGTTSAAQPATLSNPSAASLTISALVLTSGTDFTISGHDCPGSLAGGASCVVTTAFQPQANGAAIDSLRITTDQGVLSVTVQGTGFDNRIFDNGFEN